MFRRLQVTQDLSQPDAVEVKWHERAWIPLQYFAGPPYCPDLLHVPRGSRQPENLFCKLHLQRRDPKPFGIGVCPVSKKLFQNAVAVVEIVGQAGMAQNIARQQTPVVDEGRGSKFVLQIPGFSFLLLTLLRLLRLGRATKAVGAHPAHPTHPAHPNWRSHARKSAIFPPVPHQPWILAVAYLPT